MDEITKELFLIKLKGMDRSVKQATTVANSNEDIHFKLGYLRKDLEFRSEDISHLISVLEENEGLQNA